ncbi:hypothetical protein Poly51_32700 [Rubripirellula tenax]|uniref:Uncharacterized protein n=1 Tax=Rubripirellula tenax TaxID=2528015 RepID=A0A5C6F524_9BACT|nr:hypothetical protein [Rubripirellula tenax]TWU54551.1 hypothetical protein Poly51_32700 [Rubripirellula tenax]
MIHYTCDRCKRQINADEENRYVVQIEIQTASEIPIADFDDDVDQLNELNELLEGLHDESLEQELLSRESMEVDDIEDQRMRYDLCQDCHLQFAKNPLGRDMLMAIGFSDN